MKHKGNYIMMEISAHNSEHIRFDIPKQLLSGGFLLMIEGECSAVIDSHSYKLKPQDLIVAFPFSVIQILGASRDFRALTVGVESEFLNSFEIPSKGDYFIKIKDHPSIALSDEEREKILSLTRMLEDNNAQHELLFKSQIDESILNIIIYEIARIYRQHEPNREMVRSREEIIFHNFIFQVFSDFKSHRKIDYYARKQQITPSHLSRTVKRASGKGAQDWITECVINNIKTILRNTTLSISAISDDFNFANSSFFTQYFKRYTHITPREYRKEAAED